MLGLRPRLKHRPSLLDLIQRHNLEAGSAISHSHLPTVDDELPVGIPLPSSPTLSRTSRSYSTPPATPQRPQPVRIETAPPPARLKFTEEAKMASRPDTNVASDENTGKVYSVSGPVIVAEDMIGCAMYELVSWHCQTGSKNVLSRHERMQMLIGSSLILEDMQ